MARTRAGEEARAAEAAARAALAATAAALGLGSKVRSGEDVEAAATRESLYAACSRRALVGGAVSILGPESDPDGAFDVPAMRWGAVLLAARHDQGPEADLALLEGGLGLEASTGPARSARLAAVRALRRRQADLQPRRFAAA